MSNPRVSVIMGIYNGEKTMRRAIDSIVSQTYTDWELIICDDCSNDNTYKIASEYAENDKRIKVIRNETNMRLAYSLNHCLSVAQGEYIARMDDDDVCMPERFEKQVEYLDAHPEMAVVGSTVIVFDENGDLGVRGLGTEYPIRTLNKLTIPFAHPTIMMRKTVYDLLGGYTVSPETLRAEDLDMWYRFRLEKLDGYVIQEPLLRYYVPIEAYKKRSVKAAKGMVKIKKKYFKPLGVPKRYWFLIYKPLVSAILPNWLMALYHKRRLK